MKRTSVLLRRSLYCAALAAFAVAPSLRGQATAPGSAEPAADDDEEIITLSPFTVESSEDEDRYLAKSTLAGTRVRTDLKDVASSISVITSQFLQDTGSKNSQDLLVYTTNTEVGGLLGNFSGVGGVEAPALLRPQTNTRVRGLDAADNTRDYFLTDIPWDSYIVDRVDMQRGPNSILFGIGSPAGIINTSVNTATFKNGGSVENRFGQYNSNRVSLDYNYVILPDQLSVRIAAVDDHERYQQKPAYQHARRFFGAVRYEPKLFGEGSTTSIRANFEGGEIRANRPRTLPPADHLTRWFRTGIDENGYANPNRITVNPITTWTWMNANPGPQEVGAAWPQGVAPWWAYSGMGRSGNNSMSMRYDATDSAPIMIMPTVIGVAGGINENGEQDGTIGGIPFTSYYSIAGVAAYSRYANVVGAGAYRDQSLSDSSIFDFYNKLMDGNNKHEFTNWHAANIAIDQTFFGNRLGFQFVYDTQRYKDEQIGFLNSGEYVLSVDINTNLVDGSLNPNVGRPYVGNSGQYGNTENYIDRDSMRLTGYAELRASDFFDKESKLAKILGRHVFTGLASRDVKRTDTRNFVRWATTQEFADATHQDYDLTTGGMQVDWIAYLGDSRVDRNTPSGWNLSNVQADINPARFEKLYYFDSTWVATGVNPADPYVYTAYTNTDLEQGPIGGPVTVDGIQADNPANYAGWTTRDFEILDAEDGDRERLYTQGQKGRNQIDSVALTWQGYLFDDLVVPTVGWRKDTVKAASAQAPKSAGNISRMNYGIDRSGELEQSDTSLSWGVVIHSPQFVKDALGGTNVSLFYNSGRNWQAGTPRGDIFGQILDNPTGETKEYGVAVSALNDRLSLKVTKYETKVVEATLGSAAGAGFGNDLYYVWALPYWGATHALAALDGTADPQLRQGNWGWPWNGIATLPDGSPDNARIRAIARDFFLNFPLPQAFCDAYGINMNVDRMHVDDVSSWYLAVPDYGSGSIADGGNGASLMGLQPLYQGALGNIGAGPSATATTKSSGYEVELAAQFTKSWQVSVNASKTEAEYSAVSPTVGLWIDTMTEFFAGDAGLLKLWGGNTFRQNWNDNILMKYNLFLQQIGQQATEVPVWRFNAVTNYNFREGALKGTNVGLAYRWEDRRVLGYGVDTAGNYDINQPMWGPTDQHFDLWAGYGRKVTDKINWRIQLNVRNAGESSKLVPVSINPDGETALARIQSGMSWSITNTFKF